MALIQCDAVLKGSASVAANSGLRMSLQADIRRYPVSTLKIPPPSDPPVLQPVVKEK